MYMGMITNNHGEYIEVNDEETSEYCDNDLEPRMRASIPTQEPLKPWVGVVIIIIAVINDQSSGPSTKNH